MSSADDLCKPFGTRFPFFLKKSIALFGKIVSVLQMIDMQAGGPAMNGRTDVYLGTLETHHYTFTVFFPQF